MTPEAKRDIRAFLSSLAELRSTGEKIGKTEFGLALLGAVAISRAMHGSRDSAVSAVLQLFDAICRVQGFDPLQVFALIENMEVATRENSTVDPSLN